MIINPFTKDPKDTPFGFQTRAQTTENGCFKVELRDKSAETVRFITKIYESHGDKYDISHIASVSSDHLWDDRGFNTYPHESHLDIMVILSH